MIKKIGYQDIDWVVQTIVKNRKTLPQVYKNPMPDDLLNAKSHYLGEQGALYVFLEQSEAVGIIGRRVYEPRFCAIDDVFELNKHTMEVVHLYIDKNKRRQGFATRLFQNLKQDAKENGVQKLYLHTHPTLPNAQTFWQAQGFDVIGEEVIGGMLTVHMLMIL